mgnify:FL=1|jgi:hypothetical protein|tara:strand:- start:2390 stop:3571 length:1182 start_codon:yes stop_codon:yes gene_type:complete
MAKKSSPSINLGLDSSQLDRLNRASRAAAGVGEFKQTSLGAALGDIAVESGTKLVEDARLKEEEEAQEREEQRKALESKLQGKLDEFLAVGSNQNEYDFGLDKIMGIREQILNSTDEKERSGLIREFNAYVAEIKNQTNLDKTSAKNLQGFSMNPNENKSIISSATDQRAVGFLEKFYAGEAQITQGEDGKKIYRIEVPSASGVGPPDVFEGTRDELEGMLIPKATEFDLSIGKLAKAVQQNAAQGGFFDEQDIRRQINNNLNSKDYKSLFADKLETTGRTVIDDISKEIDNLTYQDLLTPDQLKQFNISPDEGETNWYDNISPDDKQQLLKTIQEDPNIGQSVLSNYFFRFVSQQDEKYAKARRDTSMRTAKLKADIAQTEGAGSLDNIGTS